MRKGLGEIGLDFNRMFSPQKDQEACFSAQLALAGKLDMPLIFHERDSKGRFYEILKSDGPSQEKGWFTAFRDQRRDV